MIAVDQKHPFWMHSPEGPCANAIMCPRVNLDLLHIVLFACTLPCVLFTLREMRGAPLPPACLGVPPLLAITCTLLLLVAIGDTQPPWTFGAALVSGLAVGWARGSTMQLQVDSMSAHVRLPWARGSFLVALGLVAAVSVEIGGTFAGIAGTPLRLLAADIAAAGSGVLTGRMIAIAIRWHGAHLPAAHREHATEITNRR